MGQNRPFLLRHAVGFAAAPPVVPAHEPIERGERADAHHDQVAGLAAGHGNFFQARGPCELLLPGFPFEKQTAAAHRRRAEESSYA